MIKKNKARSFSKISAIVFVVGIALIGMTTYAVFNKPAGAQVSEDSSISLSLNGNALDKILGALGFGEQEAPSVGAVVGPDRYDRVNFRAGQLHAYNVSTSTVTTAYTLTKQDIRDADTLTITPNVGALTLTFFASSTASDFLPQAGNRQFTCIYNATSTAAATITLAEGTGIDIETVATSTTSVPGGIMAIPAGGSACINMVRKPATSSAFDISVLYTAFVDIN